ncbi:MAG: hypothetical protein ACK5MQ_11545, partial [Pikeienuella sp.]
MRRAGWFLAAALPAATAWAAPEDPAPVRLRAMDIAGASRVELPLGGAGFAIERSGERQIDLIAEGEPSRVDLTEIFPGGFARRVVSARLAPEEDGIRLRFVLNCDCDYAARMVDGVLALEFRDPGGESPSFAAARQISVQRCEAPRPQPLRFQGGRQRQRAGARWPALCDPVDQRSGQRRGPVPQRGIIGEIVVRALMGQQHPGI